MSFEAMNWAVKIIEAHPGMSSNTRFVLVIMANRADEEGALFPSVRWIMERTGLSETTVRSATREIQKMGLLAKENRTREDGGQSSNLYRLSMQQYVLQLVPPPAPKTGGVSDGAPGGAHSAGEGVLDAQGVPAHGAPLETKEDTKEKKKTHCPLAADVFEEVVKAYPKRVGNDPLAKAVKAWNARLREGEKPETIRAGVLRYAAFCASTGKVNTEKVMMRATFFGPDKPYEQEFGLAPVAGAPVAAAVLNGSWWKTSDGVKLKGAELGEPWPAEKDMYPGWFYDYQHRVLAKAGPGPWMDDQSEVARRAIESIRAKLETAEA